VLGAGWLGVGPFAAGALGVPTPPLAPVVLVVVAVPLVVVPVPPAWLAATPPFPLDRCVGL
jgi:hypothetical protein